MALAPDLVQRLRCPVCRGSLADLRCIGCGRTYPRRGDVPVLLDRAVSLFEPDDIQPETVRPPGLGRFLPELGENLKAAANYRRFAELIGKGRVLVVGGRILGEGMEALAASGLELVETDVALGPRTQIVCDAHALPFADETFDGVIAQAVLEHVLEPVRCVAEMRRVLKPGGVVYAETPFMQQVHAGAYDFHRFTHLGHRRLFREFDEVDSGAACGPGMALAWSFTYFLQSFATTSRQRRVARALGIVASYPLRFVDPLLIDRPATLDAASAVYFLGKKSGQTLSDGELTRQYRGMDHR
jgi:SAM-dependent methyltransferase